MKPIRVLFSALLLTLVAFPAFSQVTNSSMSGSIKDDNGELAAGVVVLAIHTPSGTQYYATSNEKGIYYIDGMRPGGPYTVELSCIGKQSIRHDGIILSLAQEYVLNAVMKDDLELLQESIVIATANTRFGGNHAGATTNISTDQISYLPTSERIITDLTRISPYSGNGLSILGRDGRVTNFTIDGANFNNNLGLGDQLPAGGSPISLDALSEIQVVVTPFDIRQSNFVGGAINAITKSGTNQYNGSAYYLSNINKEYTIGATLGGPIIKGKLFFFANLESTISPSSIKRWLPSEDGTIDSKAYLARTTIADCKAVSDFVKDKYGYDTAWFDQFPTQGSNHKILTKLDWNISQAHKLSIRYNYTINHSWHITNGNSVDGGTLMSSNRNSSNSVVFTNSLYAKEKDVSTLAIDINSRIADKVHNEFLATYSSFNDVRKSNSELFPFIDILEPDRDGVLQAYMSLGYEPFSYNNELSNSVFTLKDDLTYYFGEHQITLGISYEFQKLSNAYMRNGTGYYRYDSVKDFLTEAAPSIVSLSYGYDGTEKPFSSLRYADMACYIQDSWSVSDNLHLNSGLRFSRISYNSDDLSPDSLINTIDYSGNGWHLSTYGNTLTPEQEAEAYRINVSAWPKDDISFSPRIGFIWDVFGDKSLKLRGGTGIFAGRIPWVLLLNMPNNAQMMQSQATINATGLFGGKKADMSTFAGGLKVDEKGKATSEALLYYLSSFGYASRNASEDMCDLSYSIVAIDNNFKLPQEWKSSVAVDYKFPTSFPLSVTAEAIFHKSLYDVYIKDISIKDVSGFERFAGVDNRHIFPADHRLFHFISSDVETMYVPHTYLLTNTSQGYGSALTCSINASPIRNLKLLFSYTHSSSYELTGVPDDEVNSAIAYIPSTEGINNAKLHPSPQTIPNRFLLSLSYKFDWGTNISAIYEAIHGKSNYSYMYANDMNGDGHAYDLIYIPKDSDDVRFISENDKERFWDLVDRDPYLSSHKGQYAEAYSVYLPWIHRVDLRLSQDFKLKLGSNTHTLQFNLNITNLQNLISPKMGTGKSLNPALNNGRILKYEGQDAEGYPTYSTPKSITTGLTYWSYNAPNASKSLINIGVKYLFN